MACSMYAVRIVVDGQFMGEVKNGGSLTLDVSAGQRAVQATCGLISKTTTINITDGQTQRYEMYINWLNLLKFHQA